MFVNDSSARGSNEHFLQFLVATGRVDKTDPVKIALLLRQ